MFSHLYEKLRVQIGALKDQSRLSKEQAIILAVLSVVMAIGGFLAARQASPVPVVIEKPRDSIKVDVRKKKELTDESSGKKRKKSLYVHVGGAVANPGLHKLILGDRVDDAVRKAGGQLAGARLDEINLAAPVRDGQKILVPAKQSELEATAAQLNDDPRININAATLDELEELDGVGPVIAERIDTWRERHGPFSRKDQINEIEGIGVKKYNRLKEQVRLE